MSRKVPVLVISGSLGSGKTTVLSEASDLLEQAEVAHAAIDLDCLAIMHPRKGRPLDFANLAAIWPIYKDAGAQRLLVARVVEERSELQWYKQAVPGAEIVVCRLRAPIATMQKRVRVREPGMFQRQGIVRCAELADTLERTRAEDFTVDNSEGRLITEVAREMLLRASWLQAAP